MEEAAYQAAAEAVVASEFSAEVFGLEIRPVDPMIGADDWRGRCLRAGGVLEFGTENDGIDEYDMYAGKDALADRIRRISMCRLAPLAGFELLNGQSYRSDELDLPAMVSKIPIEEMDVDLEGEIRYADWEKDADLTGYVEQSKEVARSRWSVIQSLAQRLLSQRALNAIEIAEVLEVNDA
jgi:hypothetical protein